METTLVINAGDAARERSEAAALSAHHTSVQIRVGGDGATDPFASAFNEAGPSLADWRGILECWRELTARNTFSVVHLDLSSSGIRTAELVLLADAVEEWWGGLEVLDLRETPLDEHAAEPLERIVRSAEKLHTLRISPSSDLEHAEHCIGNAGALAVASGLSARDSERQRGLKEIMLIDSGVGSKGICALLNARDITNTVEVMDLSGNTMGGECVRVLSHALPLCSALKALSLVRCGLDEDALVSIITSLRLCLSLQKLDLGGNAIGDAVAKAVADLLLHCKTLTAVYLSNSLDSRTFIGREGADALGCALLSSGSTASEAQESEALALPSLDMPSLLEPDELETVEVSAANIGRALPRYTAMQHAKGSAQGGGGASEENDTAVTVGAGKGSEAGHGGATNGQEASDSACTRASAGNEEDGASKGERIDDTRTVELPGDTRALTVLGGTARELVHSCAALEILELSHHVIGPHGARSLASALSRCTAMRILELNGCELGEQGIAALLHASGAMPSLECLGVRECLLSVSAMREAAFAIERAGNLRALDLSASRECNVMGKEAHEAFDRMMTAMGDNETLLRFSIAGRGLGDDGAVAIARMLQRNSALQYLDIQCNEIGKDGGLAIAKALSHSNDTLLQLELGGFLDHGRRTRNNIPPMVAGHIGATMGIRALSHEYTAVDHGAL